MPGTLNWLQNPESQSSSHYLIAKDGTIYQLVYLKDRSWSSGRINKPSTRGKKMMSRYPQNTKPGEYLIQIEVECLEHETYTEAQYTSIVWLMQNVFDFDTSAENLLTHQDTASYKPHLEAERTHILKMLGNNNQVTIAILLLKVEILKLQIMLKKLLSTGG